MEGIWNLLGCPMRPKIYCDGLPDASTPDETDRYHAYIDELIALDIGIVVEHKEWCGLVGLVQRFISDCLRSVILNVQHDWDMVEPDRVDSERLVWLLVHDPTVQCVRFTKRSLPQRNGHVDRHYYEVDKSSQFGIPLIATDGWGDSPHFASYAHYVNRVAPNLSADFQRDYGRYGVEGPVWRAYQRDIRQRGFAAAHRDWGSFLYGKFGEGPYVKHLGGEARKWRESRQLLDSGSQPEENSCPGIDTV